MSFVKVKAGRSSGAPDRTTFVGALIPRSIKRLPEIIEKIGLSVFKKLLAVVVSLLEGNDVGEDALSALVTGAITQQLLSDGFAGLNDLLSKALRHPAGAFKKTVFTEDLLALGLQNEHAIPISNVVYGPKRSVIDQRATDDSIKLPGLASFKWRVDVAISTSELKRAMKPGVLMQMTLTDGKIHTFEMPVEQFHKLRYNAAFVLKEMDDLMSRPVMQK